MFNNYIDNIFETSSKYLNEILSKKELSQLVKDLSDKKTNSIEDCINLFSSSYNNLIKLKYQNKYKKSDSELDNFINDSTSNIKVLWGDCLDALKSMKSESIHCMVTSPPYYNAREYSYWENIDLYLMDMRNIIRESYRVLDNHRVWVFNVGDVFDNPRNKTKSVWGKTRLPLGAYFIKIFEEEGFTFIDDIIWDKGEVQSERNKAASNPYPFYQYPNNSYEHILIFHKHRLDLTKIPCPICGSLNVNGNTQSEVGLQSWECKNLNCFERSKSNRGKRFSQKSNMMQSKILRNKDNFIERDLVRKWRKDIIKFSPVIKINSKGENTLGHTAPFPPIIPEMATRFFTYVGEKVLDPFAGSFTSPKVAAQLDRIGIGVELNKDLFSNSILKNLTSIQGDMFKSDIKFSEYNIK